MLNTLHARLVMMLIMLFVLVTSLLVFAFNTQHKSNQDLANQRMHAELAKQVAKTLNPWPSGDIDKAAVKEAFNLMMILGPAIELYVVSLKGELLAYDATPSDLIQMQVATSAIDAFFEWDQSQPLYGDDPRSQRKKVFSAAPIMEAGQPKGYLYIIIGGQDYDRIWSTIANNQAFTQLLWILAALLTLLLLASLIIVRLITRPLANLSRTMAQYQQSGFRCPIAPSRHASLDIRILQVTFRRMAGQISNQLKSLQQQQQQRLALLTQMSHDLQTPIAAQQAYLETLVMQGDALSLAQQSHFIHKAYGSAQRLQKRVDEILQLARLEQELDPIRIEAVELAPLVTQLKDISAPLAKPLNCQLIWPNVQGQVCADATKLERILLNLIENALSHARASHIEILIEARANQWRFSVQDNGQGLSKHQSGQLSDHRHLGLGLQICQGLITLHQSQLHCDSQPKQGCCFWFELPRVKGGG